jgi:hypothetical protein
MNTQAIFEILCESDLLAEQRRLLRDYLLKQFAEYRHHPDRGPDLAYEIAGLMATRAISNLPANDAHQGIFHLAGELELPPAHRETEATWDRLGRLIDDLPAQPL